MPGLNRSGGLSANRAMLVTTGAALIVLLFGLPTLIIPLGTDQVLYALGARTILDGGALYSDFWEIKAPMVFLFYAAPLATFGEHAVAIRLLDLANTLAGILAVYLLGRRFFSQAAALLGALLFGVTYLTWGNVGALAEAEAFMVVPLALAFYVYLPRDDARSTHMRAVAAGLLLGFAFTFKGTALLFFLGLPVAELLFRDEGRWSPAGAARRMVLAAAGFVAVQAAVVVYLAIAGGLSDFVDIQRNYTQPYSQFLYPEGTQYLRFLVDETSNWTRDTPHLIVPAAVGIIFALFRPRHQRGAYFLALLAIIGVAGIWWQGKMFNYHWLIILPLLAPLGGFGLEQLWRLFTNLPEQGRRLGLALLGALILLLFLQPLLHTYDGYRVLARRVSGSMSQAEVDVHYFELLEQNHQLVSYVRENGSSEDQLFVWGLWPVIHFWLDDRPLVSRFAANHGLRATWAPESWRNELMADLEAAQPACFAIGQGDVQPWLVGTNETSQEHFQNNFPALRSFVESGYELVLDNGLFHLYQRRDSS